MSRWLKFLLEYLAIFTLFSCILLICLCIVFWKKYAPIYLKYEPENLDVIEIMKEENVASTSSKLKIPQTSPGKVVSKSNPLCRGVTESWKLVPDPEVEGQYIICNAGGQSQMATVDELNIAINNYRASNSLNRLNISGDLCTIATERAREISVNFSHDGFENAVERSGIEKNAVGENIASGPLSAVQFVEWSWDKSPGHRANMLGDWSEGCGGVYARFAVYIFAR